MDRHRRARRRASAQGEQGRGRASPSTPTRIRCGSLRLLEGERIHRRDELEIYAVDRDFLAAWVARLTRRMKFDLSISDGQIYLVLAEATLTGMSRRVWGQAVNRESGVGVRP